MEASERVRQYGTTNGDQQPARHRITWESPPSATVPVWQLAFTHSKTRSSCWATRSWSRVQHGWNNQPGFKSVSALGGLFHCLSLSNAASLSLEFAEGGVLPTSNPTRLWPDATGPRLAFLSRRLPGGPLGAVCRGRRSFRKAGLEAP